MDKTPTFIKLKNTVMITYMGETYTVSNSHPLFADVVKAIDANEIGKLESIISEHERENFLDLLVLKPKTGGPK